MRSVHDLTLSDPCDQDDDPRWIELRKQTTVHKAILKARVQAILRDMVAGFDERPYGSTHATGTKLHEIADEFSDAEFAEWKRIFDK